jgi:hypothetical protein
MASVKSAASMTTQLKRLQFDVLADDDVEMGCRPEGSIAQPISSLTLDIERRRISEDERARKSWSFI